VRTICVNPVAPCGTHVSSLENAMSILALFDAKRPVLRVGEVCRDVGLPKSSVSRLLKTMSEHGLIEREKGDLGYVVGRRTLELADLFLTRHTLLDLIDLTIDRIVTEFGFAGYSGILSGSDLLILRLKHGAYPLRLVHPVGQRIPAFGTAIGRALLSRLPEDEAAVAMSGHSAREQRAMRRELDRTFARGIAATVSTTIPGIGAIGAGVFSPSKQEAIGFAISFPLSAADDALRLRMARWLRDEAVAIAARIGDPYWAGRAFTPLEADIPSLLDADQLGLPASSPS
jgi:DNA-binding IclR family transcriptional regulator